MSESVKSVMKIVELNPKGIFRESYNPIGYPIVDGNIAGSSLKLPTGWSFDPETDFVRDSREYAMFEYVQTGIF